MPATKMYLHHEWNNRAVSYDWIVVGSGYGGAISAARIAEAKVGSVCILERGREWAVGEFPDRWNEGLAAYRNEHNPLGLYEFITYRDISVIKGSGLGGTSLVNANVAIRPDEDVLDKLDWPAELRFENLRPFYAEAEAGLGVNAHPRAHQLSKVQALDRRARQLGRRAEPLPLAVNFALDGANAWGVTQKPCTDCGDCVSGCNVGAKNTLSMNYLPRARKAGAHIFTQVEVRWVEKLATGGWRVHGRRYETDNSRVDFQMDCKRVILAAGAINTTEILMRSEARGLSVSPALGTGFSGNGDFFGLCYNGDAPTDVLGYGTRQSPQPGQAALPGPTIVAAVHYNGKRPVEERITIEDLSFPSAYVLGAKGVFSALRGRDTDVGDENEERQRRLRDVLDSVLFFAPPNLYHRDGALNHTMLYLCMGQDDAKGTMVFADDRVRVEWDGVGHQAVFARINNELYQHTRALGGSFIANPLWEIFNTRHLITAHPIGGCPVGADYLQGAVDPYGRVYSGNGSVHAGLLVADGALLPSAISVNPFLTISALAGHTAARAIRDAQGDAYPQPATAVSMAGIDAWRVLYSREPELEKLFRRTTTLGIEMMVNSGATEMDIAKGEIRNDACWKGFFPKGHVLNGLSAAIFTGFQKTFRKEGAQITGITSDADGRINARNSLEEIEITRPTGTLEPGRYILLRYLDFPWQGYYDIFKVIQPDLIIGRVYLGQFPHGQRLFTFPMTRRYRFSEMTVDDHRRLYASAAAPTAAELAGVWRMDLISNANHAGATAYLSFRLQPDGRLEARYHLLGLMEGLVIPQALQDHFRLADFTPFHDEIRKVSADFLVGKYVTDLPAIESVLAANPSLGIFHTEPGTAGGQRFGFYYTLSRVTGSAAPANRLLGPILETHLPSGVTMTFDEEMVGVFHEGAAASAPGRAGDLQIPASGGVSCRFHLRMSIADVNEFIEGSDHEARLSGTISFDQFLGGRALTLPVNHRTSFFHYLRVNPESGEAEMRYHLEFSYAGGDFLLEGRKYMQRDTPTGQRDFNEVLRDYTTLFAHVFEKKGGTQRHVGTGLLRFRTFEDLAAVGNLAGFLASFRVGGTSDPTIQLQAQMRFLAFTGQFVQTEYDPLAPEFGVRAASGGGN